MYIVRIMSTLIFQCVHEILGQNKVGHSCTKEPDMPRHLGMKAQ